MCVSNGGTHGSGGSKTMRERSEGVGGGDSHPQAFQMKKGPTFFI